MMATRADRLGSPATNDEGFFLGAAVAMVLAIVAGFSLNFVMGRSSFSAPLLVHAHAIVFMGWVGIYLFQNIFVARGNIAMHRRLGWIGAGWIVLMLVLGCAVTLAMVRNGRVPFFFTPQQFLVFDPVTLFGFVGLTVAAIAMRRQTDWHRRLHFCAMTLLLGPAFGRLLPGPLLIPWAFEGIFFATMLFPAAGVVADLRRTGSVHPAWWWGIAVNIGIVLAVEAITYSPIGDALYESLTRGTPGAAVAPLDFPPPPPGL
jgi:hypothetical protein